MVRKLPSGPIQSGKSGGRRNHIRSSEKTVDKRDMGPYSLMCNGIRTKERWDKALLSGLPRAERKHTSLPLQERMHRPIAGKNEGVRMVLIIRFKGGISYGPHRSRTPEIYGIRCSGENIPVERNAVRAETSPRNMVGICEKGVQLAASKGGPQKRIRSNKEPRRMARSIHGRPDNLYTRYGIHD